MTRAVRVPCPRCQHRANSAEANFCSRCGGALRGPPCPSCGAPSEAGDSYCNQCGTALQPERARFGGQAARVPWAVAGMLALALVLVFVLRGGGGREIALSPPPGGSSGQGSATTPLGPTSSVDLGSMTPRQAAIRLFDRVMRALEAGNEAEANQFLPMAIASYDLIAALSLDDRFHLSLLYAAADNGEAALLTAEAGLAVRPTHILLLGAAAQAALLTGDVATARAHYQTLVEVYEEEIRAGLEEYGTEEGGHANLLPALQAEAAAYLAGTGYADDAMIESPLSLATLIAGVTALAFWLDYRFPALGKVGASMMAIIFGAILSNTGLVPVSSPVYDAVLGPITSVSIAWLLLSVNLRDLVKAGPRMTGAFVVAVVGTMIGAFVAALLYSDRFPEDTWRIAGALTGTYSGGSVNFVSVGRELGLSGTLFAGLNAADAVVTGLWLGATLILPIWLTRFYAPVPGAAPAGGAPAGKTPAAETPEGKTPVGKTAADRDAPDHDAPPADERSRHHPYFVREGLSAVGIANLFAAGLILVFVSEWLHGLYPGVPAILILTTLALALGHSPLYREAPGAMQLGSVGLHFFFVLIGILSRISEIAAVGFEVFFFTLTVVGVHGIWVLGVGKLLRLDIGTLFVASQAAVGGPSSALAVAIAREWRHLVLPGVVMGLFGYAVGTYLGLGVAYLLR